MEIGNRLEREVADSHFKDEGKLISRVKILKIETLTTNLRFCQFKERVVFRSISASNFQFQFRFIVPSVSKTNSSSC